ncbi:uncharacterized protein PGTG_03230 [Puccinia graminis f. sp. tritici CRL 75-36-700-3]|uniref:Deoxyhypusine hydroxylase n=1 Tax=Puccinia graminis f. sp. tritici (strain CRL 75-36-700-3 / race SCCL) TaxID=418459 RepID=E3JYZ9_PUCGT|nr:uncharacterized protein PGTG_03230 [Puccinia graminis f. sp. tritici CRL 75-36-700-3]EFP77274.1 hypothetical protein PGTG_03230 [Puccinia graminis f. sp. tritici CRL 75-36-700-3]
MTVLSVTEDEINELHSTLTNRTGTVPLASRFRALFTLKAIGSPPAVKAIGDALRPSKDSSDQPQALLGHELAYCLGQIADPTALPVLEATLRDTSVHPMVRHEAAEAMGAIGNPISLGILREFLKDEEVSVRETCELAIEKIEGNESFKANEAGVYGTIDPAPSMIKSFHDTSATDLGRNDLIKMKFQLLDQQKSLFERYRAMFGLRDAVRRASENDELDGIAIDALADGFSDPSALFRHEIAYVFGQLSHPLSVPALVKVLENKQEDEMVRHEAAEALGSIATPEVLTTLKAHASPEEQSRVVRESCEVALDMYNHEHSQEFQYTLPLKSV